MDPDRFSFTLLLAAVALGVILYQGLEIPELSGSSPGEKQTEENDTGFVFGSTHEHALFYVLVNGTEKELTADRFQMQSRYVHLENDRPHIVHKHAKGVTWSYFFDTLNLSVEQVNASTDDYCIDIYNSSTCDEAEILLNGEETTDFNTTIQQDDTVILAFGENSTSTAEEYKDRVLPPDYRPGRQGHSL